VWRKARSKFFVSFCGGGDFFVQKCTLVHSKTKLFFFSESVNVAMFHAYRILPRCCSQAMLHRGDCSAIKLLRIRASGIATPGPGQLGSGPRQ